MTGTGAGPLTPEQATTEALAALKAAGLGKEHGKPFTVRSRNYGRVPLHTGPECVLTEVEVKKASHIGDAAMRALPCLPGGVAFAEQGRVVSVFRESGSAETQGKSGKQSQPTEAIMYGQNHRYCSTCGHAVRYGHPQCSGCGTSSGELMMLDMAMDQGTGGGGGIGFDPLDGQFAFDIPGTDLAIEPDGQVDVDFGGLDFPVF